MGVGCRGCNPNFCSLDRIVFLRILSMNISNESTGYGKLLCSRRKSLGDTGLGFRNLLFNFCKCILNALIRSLLCRLVLRLPSDQILEIIIMVLLLGSRIDTFHLYD